MLDGFTFARLSTVGDLTGRRCLEVGAGGGSVARWLADQVGPTGHVLATDLNTRHLPTDAGYAVLRHDLVADPVPDGPWDVIHARMVLLHIPERDEILARLAAALAPGGALVVEDWATRVRPTARAGRAVTRADAELIDAYQDTLIPRSCPAAATTRRGPSGCTPPCWPSRTRPMWTPRIDARSWHGGTAGALLIVANVAQLASGVPRRGLHRGPTWTRLRALVGGSAAGDTQPLHVLDHRPEACMTTHCVDCEQPGRAPAATRRQGSSRLSNVRLPLVGTVAAIAVWWRITVVFDILPFFLPAPPDVVASFSQEPAVHAARVVGHHCTRRCVGFGIAAGGRAR